MHRTGRLPAGALDNQKDARACMNRRRIAPVMQAHCGGSASRNAGGGCRKIKETASRVRTDQGTRAGIHTARVRRSSSTNLIEAVRSTLSRPRRARKAGAHTIAPTITSATTSTAQAQPGTREKRPARITTGALKPLTAQTIEPKVRLTKPYRQSAKAQGRTITRITACICCDNRNRRELGPLPIHPFDTLLLNFLALLAPLRLTGILRIQKMRSGSTATTGPRTPSLNMQDYDVQISRRTDAVDALIRIKRSTQPVAAPLLPRAYALGP